MKYIYILISSAIVIYLILLTLIYVNQRKLLYLPSENNYLDDPINFNYKELFIEVDFYTATQEICLIDHTSSTDLMN